MPSPLARHGAARRPEGEGYAASGVQGRRIGRGIPAERYLGSTNGTFVNDVKARDTPLVDGDVIRVGTTPVAFKSHSVLPSVR